MCEQMQTLPYIDGWQDDISTWASLLIKDADDKSIDWSWVASCDCRGGIGKAAHMNINELFSGEEISALLRADFALRRHMEAILEQCNTVFMGDFDRTIASYRLPRALAYANRRLNDEINLLIERGHDLRLWSSKQSFKSGTAVTVLSPMEKTNVPIPKDPSATAASQRANIRHRKRVEEQEQHEQLARASFCAPSAAPAAKKSSGGDWRNVYLPGRDVDVVMGIDIETTGINPLRDYIIDVGFEYMAMQGERSSDQSSCPESSYTYVEPQYEVDGAYGQARLSFGVPQRCAQLGNPFIKKLTGIDVREQCEPQYRAFDQWYEAQASLLHRLEQQPYVAHNAYFEHRFFMNNVAGYAESYRDGRITIIDTMPMSRAWDEGSVASKDHPYGDNTLQAYARRWGALGSDDNERHLGLEDAHIMLVAMRKHLASLHAQGRGPWAAFGAGGIAGVGGKRCGR